MNKEKINYLIYDDNCPLCSVYTAAFVRLGLLPAEGRVPFTKASPALLSLIEIETGKNEIPLIDATTNKVFYGIDALLEILGQKMPVIKIVGSITPVNWFLKKLYKLISYNRKVIVARKCGHHQFDCSPEFNAFYRLVFLSIFLVFNSLMLLPIHYSILTNLSFYSLSFFQLESAHLLFVVTNCLIASFLPFKTALEYLGQINILALCTVLLCIPLLFFEGLIGGNNLFISLYLFALTVFVVREYFRRMRYAGILTTNRTAVKINFVCVVSFLTYLFV